MKYRDHMTPEDLGKLMEEIEEMEDAYADSDFSYISDSDSLEWWTEQELRAMRP